ncbi:MAG: hypothetical protein ACLGIF_09780 [Actinomycetes bacterium]
MASSVTKRIARGLVPVAARMAPQAAGGVLRRVLEMAIDGVAGLPGAKAVAAKQLERSGGAVDEAIEGIVDQHVRLASAQGFVTNLGGAAVLPIALSANLTGVAVVQVRMVAAIAHLRGYNLDDNRVRTALVMCLLGGEQVAQRIANGTLPTSPMAVATAPVFDRDLDTTVAQEVVADLLARIGGKSVALAISRRVPLVGGGVGAVMDGLATRNIGTYAKGELPRRRILQS